MPMDRSRYSSYVNAPKSMMGGPSMDTAGLAMSLAQQLMGSSPAMGGIGASTGSMGVLGGPAGAVMGIPMKVLSRLSEQSQNAINAFTGMPNPLRKDPMRELDAMLQQYRQVPSPALSTGTIGSIGTQNNIAPDMDEQTFSMPKMSSEEPAGSPSADNVYRFTGDEMPIDLTRDDMDFSNDPEALAISGGRIAGLDRRSRSNDFSREPEPQKIGSGLGTVARGFSGALGGLKGPDAGMLAGALRSAAANYPTERATGRMSSGAFVGGPVSPPSMGGSPSAASMMGQRPQPQPKLMGQDYQLGDYTLPQRRRTTGYGGTGGGF